MTNKHKKASFTSDEVFDYRLLEGLASRHPELKGRTLTSTVVDYGERMILEVDGAEPVIVDLYRHALLDPEERRTEEFYFLEQLAHGSFNKLIDKYETLRCAHNALKQVCDDRKALIEVLSNKIDTLEAVIETWKGLYETERQCSFDNQQADDVENGRLQGDL